MTEDEHKSDLTTSSTGTSSLPRWTASHRPESTVVQNFSADLDSMFGLSPDLDNLSQTVTAKQQTVSSAEQELQALEARLRETEQRLAKASRQNSPSRPHAPVPPPAPPKQALDGPTAMGNSPLAQRPTFPADRPPTAGQHPHRHQQVGAQSRLHQEHGGGGNSDYVMVDRNGQ